jgi:Tfp pilus assembly protein PilX
MKTRIGRRVLRLFWPRRRPGDDAGVALVLVVGSMLVLTMFATGALAYAVNTMPLSRHDQDFNAALGAAQAGIDDYIRHLNENDSYWAAPDCTNEALVGPLGTGCDHSATVGWQPVNAGGNPNGPEFHYDIDATSLSTSAALTVTATGKVNGVTRTLQATVSRGGSTEFVYYTNYEDADPANTVIYPTPPNSQCSEYWWQGRSTYNSSGTKCQEIQFASGDVINGPAHTNDTPLIGGNAEFVGLPSKQYSIETADPGCKTAKSNVNDYFGCWRGNSSTRPTFDKPPGYADTLQLPDNSAQLALDPGCDYVGQTRIRFTGDGKMLVWSPETTATNSATTASCGGSAPNGVSVAVPNMQVIYASNNPDVAPHQCSTATQPNGQVGEIGDGLPIDGDVTMATSDQYCGQGNIYVEGTVQGRVTIGAENSIVVTGDLLLKNGITGNDLVGLVAGNNVEIMHPWIATTTTVPTGTCQTYGWQETPGQWVSTSPSDQGYRANSLGWEEGYFTGSGTNATWHSGQWETTRTSSQFWQGPSSKPTSLTGSWVSASSPHPKSGEVWQSGTWTANSNGSFSWTAGKWVTAPAGEYWQGESWSLTCTQYQTRTTTTYAESTTWPHRVYSSGSNEQIQIYASIQTLQHSFWVQNYNQGTAQGQLTVYGSIAQNYRGIVGQSGGWSGNTGYLKNYNYDARLVTQSPPYFPQWENAQWTSVRLGEIQPRYQ